MKRAFVLTLVLIAASAGCTTVSLEQYTLNQNRSCGECRDTSVLDCLAAVAAEPDTLPSFSLYTFGLTTVTDTINADQRVTWAEAMRTLAALGIIGSRAPKGQWTVDPSAS